MKTSTEATENISEEPVSGKRKRGEKREDGRTFFRYRADGREVWLTDAQLEHRKAKDHARNEAYLERKRAAGIKPENPLKRGFVREDGMVFWAYGNNGNENWCTVEEFAIRSEKSTQARKRHQSDNREKEAARCKQWRENNPEKAKEIFKASREKFREQRNLALKEWKLNNADYVSEYQKRYREENKTAINAHLMDRYYNDPLFNLACKIRSRTSKALKASGFKKKAKTIDMLGCNWEEFKAHIESQFVDGMSWERLSEIHLDHVIPLASAKTEEEMVMLAHYTNIKPMWGSENQSKNAKLPEDFVDRYEALCKIAAQRA